MLCKHHNGCVLSAALTSTRAPFCAVYCQSESSALDSNKLEEQESLRFVPDVTLRNSCRTSSGVTWVTKAMYTNMLKSQGSQLYNKTDISHMRCVHSRLSSAGRIPLIYRYPKMFKSDVAILFFASSPNYRNIAFAQNLGRPAQALYTWKLVINGRYFALTKNAVHCFCVSLYELKVI